MMEYMTVKESTSEALSCLKDIEGTISGNVGLSEEVDAQLIKAQNEVQKLYDKLPSNMLSLNNNGYVPKKRQT